MRQSVAVMLGLERPLRRQAEISRLAGVSLVTSYRSTFGQEIQAKGIDGLIQTLAEKNAHGETMPADTAKQG